MEPFQLTNEKYLIIKHWFEKYGLTCGFTTKNDGYSDKVYTSQNFGFHVGDQQVHVIQNRIALAQELQFPLENWVGAEQTHGVHIEYVQTKDRGKGAKEYDTAFAATDALFTDEKDLLLTMCYADCIPLYFFHPKSQHMAVAHAGWKGTVFEIAKNAIDAFREKGIHPQEVEVVIGPGICRSCYIVDNYVINKVNDCLGEIAPSVYNEIAKGQYQLDLKRCNQLILQKYGVLRDNIHTTEYCTSCHESLFFSHRRDDGKTGRLMSFIGLREEE